MRRIVGPVSRAVRFRVAGALIILGLIIEAWTLFQINAFGFMFYIGAGLSLIGLGVMLNVYWVAIELTATTDGSATAAPAPADSRPAGPA